MPHILITVLHFHSNSEHCSQTLLSGLVLSVVRASWLERNRSRAFGTWTLRFTFRKEVKVLFRQDLLQLPFLLINLNYLETRNQI